MAMPNSFLHPFSVLSSHGYHGYNIKFSPVEINTLAICAAENFGIKGNGALFTYSLSAKQPSVKKLEYADAIFDCSWVLADNGIILTGSGDGCVQIWNTRNHLQVPESCRKIHHKEVSSVESCNTTPAYFSTSSWDSRVTLCELNTLLPTCNMIGHTGIVYEAVWSHNEDRTLASVSEDGRAVIWSPFSSPKPTLTLPSVHSELLSCDWSYSDPNLLVTSSASAILYGWDLRSPNTPVFELMGHENAIRKVRFSPFISNEIISVSYDFSTRLWNCAVGAELSIARQHTEFVYGVDYSPLSPGVVADCSWDQKIHIYRIDPRPVHPLGPSVPSQIHSAMPLKYQRNDLHDASSNIWSSHISNTSEKPLPPLPSGAT